MIAPSTRGVFYMGQLRRTWKTKRPEYERHLLAMASYNAGSGNIIRAQKICNSARDWKDISPCLCQVTGHHCKETRTYIDRIVLFWAEISDNEPSRLPRGMRSAQTKDVLSAITERYDIRRYFSGSAWGTYYGHWDGWITADHVFAEVRANPPEWVDGLPLARFPGEIDTVYYGDDLPSSIPREMRRGETVYIVGYPGGADQPTLRVGRVYWTRKERAGSDYIHPGTIVVMPNPGRFYRSAEYEPVVGGMSGGPIFSEDLEPLATLVTQNSMADLTGDLLPDASADVIPLRDFFIKAQAAEN